MMLGYNSWKTRRSNPGSKAPPAAERQVREPAPSRDPTGGADMEENKQGIRNFIDAWSRLDRTQAGEKSADLPCVGLFEIEAGKTKVWCDYFDVTTYQNALA